MSLYGKYFLLDWIKEFLSNVFTFGGVLDQHGSWIPMKLGSNPSMVRRLYQREERVCFPME